MSAGERAPLVLATRPEPGASALASKLIDLGYRALAAPSLEIAPVEAVSPRDLSGVDRIVFTSANAVRAVAASLGDDLSEATRLGPAWCVGEATAEAARKVGFEAIAAGGDGAALEAALIAAVPRGAVALHLCGADIAHDLGPGLAAAGIGLASKTVYRARPATALPAEAQQALRAGDAVALFLSARAAAAFRALAPDTPPRLAICVSERTRAAIDDWDGVSMRVAAAPTLEAVIEALHAASPPRSGATPTPRG